MKSRGKYCVSCRKFEKRTILGTDSKEPANCVKFSNQSCSKVRSINSYLDNNFPTINLNPHLYEAREGISDIKSFKSEEVLKENEEFSYWSVRLRIHSNEAIEKSKEIWRCKSEIEADKVIQDLSDYEYYWIPLDESPELFKVKVEL